jgi:anion-transporting  ArsA/GET3 family ATPase
MSLILTFLGKGGSGRSTVAIATAKKLSAQGKKVLLLSEDTTPALGLLLGTSVGTEPTEVAVNFQAIQLSSTVLLEKGWEQLKQLEAEYLRNPVLKNVYGQELSVLPGMDAALNLNAVREYDASGKYDVLIYDGESSKTTLRMLGLPEGLSWYFRRFRAVLEESDFWKGVSPFIQPVSSAVLNVSWSGDGLPSEPTQKVNQFLDQGKSLISDSHRIAAFLVTTGDPSAIATAKYLWGSSQQVGLTVGGVILNQALIPDTMAAEFAASLQKLYQTFDQEADITDTVTKEFAPLPISNLPMRNSDNWQSLSDTLPDFTNIINAPKPIEIDVNAREVRLFLPSFDKKQVKLTQYGPEVTIEAGDQRRNILLPPQLSGQPVKGAKFQNSYLTISF